MPVPLAATGLTLGSMRRHDDTFIRTPACEALLAEVRAPRPHRDRHVHLARQRVEPDLAVAEERDRPHVAGVEPALAHGELARLDELVARVRDLHHDELGGVEQALDVVGEPEHRRARRRSRRCGCPRTRPSRSAGVCVSTWTRASSHGTSSPSIQIFSVFSIGIRLQTPSAAARIRLRSRRRSRRWCR